MADKTTITSLDIGTSKVLAVIAVYDPALGHYKILGHGSVPSKGVKKGVVVDIDQVTEVVEQAIQKAERMAGIAAAMVTVSVGGPHIAALNSHGVVAVSNPKGDISSEDIQRVIEAARAVSLPANRKVLYVSPRQYTVDGQGEIHNPAGMSGVRLEVDCHIITASSTNLRNYDRVLEIVDVQNQGFIYSAMAASQVLLTESERDLGIAVIDIGAGKIDMTVYVDGSLTHCASLPIGARHITSDIAIGLRLPLDVSEELKVHLSDHYRSTGPHGKTLELPDISSYLARSESSDYTAKAVYENIISPRLEEIVHMIQSELEKAGLDKSLPAGIVLTGGGARTIGLVEHVKAILRVPVKIGTLQVHLSGMADELMTGSSAVAVGLLTYAQQIESGNQDSIMGSIGRTITSRTKGTSSGSSILTKIKAIIHQFLP